jgi:hypothetical protein
VGGGEGQQPLGRGNEPKKTGAKCIDAVMAYVHGVEPISTTAKNASLIFCINVLRSCYRVIYSTVQ